eukprot:CAMPEP_0185805006 /NCGR_PEP_ID=MMETSP1322-20130828/3592_1 /TAXON_ID=265543 /ORGANISM="Minutocellus polymorphus, Strain RCC2270" /LENGTH=388 /DNA_ID=CAMNT_0028501013 /DNA_START=109 /DNA_END=1275 /DNA_ORIENTATION=+
MKFRRNSDDEALLPCSASVGGGGGGGRSATCRLIGICLSVSIVAIFALDEVRVRYLRHREHNLLGYKCAKYQNPYYFRLQEAPSSPAPIGWFWQASYPGSGADLTADLTRTLTGYETGYIEELDELAALPQHTLAVKTHWPAGKYFYEGDYRSPSPQLKRGSPQFLQQFWEDVLDTDSDSMNRYDPRPYASRVLLLLRHPMSAIPSYFNNIFEENNGLDGHSTHAPLDEWIGWRDSNFDDQLMSWVNHTRYWLDLYPDQDDRYISSYESLTSKDEKSGKKSALQLARFLLQTPGVDTALLDVEDDVTCTWYQVVVDAKGGTQRSVNANGAQYVRPYDASHLDRMEEELTKLKSEYGRKYRDVADLMMVYLQMLRDKRKTESAVGEEGR